MNKLAICLLFTLLPLAICELSSHDYLQGNGVFSHANTFDYDYYRSDLTQYNWQSINKTAYSISINR